MITIYSHKHIYTIKDIAHYFYLDRDNMHYQETTGDGEYIYHTLIDGFDLTFKRIKVGN